MQLVHWWTQQEILICSAVLTASIAWVTTISLLLGVLNWGEAYLIPYLAGARAQAGTGPTSQSINQEQQ